MKKVLLIVFLASFSGLCAQGKLPSLKLTDLKGKTVDISTMTNEEEFTVISFWATWCVPCINELDAIYDALPDWQEEIDIKIVAVTVDDARTASRVRPMVNAKLWDFEVLFDTNQELKRFLHIETIPYLIVVKDGIIVHRHSGYSTGSENELFEELKKI